MNREALYAALENYLEALGNQDAGAVRWADGARHSENNVMLEPGDGVWRTIERVGDYRLRFADEKAGQVGYFGTVVEPMEESAFSMRLKVEDGGAISESEMVIVRDSDSGLKLPNPRFYTKPILEADAEAPVSREEMQRLANGYFETLELNDGEIHTRFHPECNRVENGFQSTNAPENAEFIPTTGMGCEEQFRLGFYRYDDRLRGRRFPLIDEQRGIVLAHGFIDHCGALDRYQLTNGEWVDSFIRRPHSFYLAEIFKIDHGMICQIEANFITVPYHMKSPWDGR